MNKNTLETQWPQVREMLRERFSNLSEADIREINGRYDQLVMKLQQKYGYSREEAEERIQNWNFDKAPGQKSQIMRDEKIKENTLSPYVWPLALGIPLLLLGTYFLSPPHTSDVPKSTTQQEFATQGPRDFALSNDLREAFLSQENRFSEIQNVQISANNGVVTLSGRVPDQETKDFIINTAENHTGVREVIDRLQVQ